MQYTFTKSIKARDETLPTMRCILALLFVLGAVQLHVHVNAEPASLAFISIDCGLTSGSSYTDELTSITYTSDSGYIETGENHNISSEYQGHQAYRSGLNVRSFPNGGRNCYTLSSAIKDNKYLLRGTFMHGNYDGKNQDLLSSSVKFDIYIGLDLWYPVNISNASTTYVFEAIVVAVVNSISVCLIDNGNGTPFISSLEMRPMKRSIYPAATTNQSLGLYRRRSMGASRLVRYPDDPYDRFWWAPQDASGLVNLSTTKTISHLQDDVFEAPGRVLQTAVATSAKSVPLNMSWVAPNDWALNLHFADFQQSLREFNISYNGYPYNGPEANSPCRPWFLSATYVNSTGPYTSPTGHYCSAADARVHPRHH